MKSVIIAVGAAIAVVLVVLFYNSSKPASGPPGGGAPGPCAGGNPHCIVVTVSGGAINPIPDHEVHDAGAVIFWEIGTSGYTFPANGIAFNKPAFPAPAGEFNCSPVSSTSFKCIDAYHNMGKFGYTVTLSGSPAVPPLDPLIINH